MGTVPDLHHRARVHAALGEPVRLAITDRLALADASPGDLATALGMATNLLAHHLGVLEQAGVIRRVRSEGDRRRSYVHLRLDDPTVLSLTGPASPARLPTAGDGTPPRVVFVCTQNSARSQLAAALWRARTRAIPVASAGTRPAARVHPRAVETGRRHGLRLGNARTHRLSDIHRPGDLLVAVCDNAHEELPDPADLPRLHWSLPDPVGAGTEQAFEVTYQQLTPRLDQLVAALAPSG
jgi:ArsR family transcriptional regulator, arsenate/arsenite/antimonite-responsive transcriptional repressor / arsenate reductase (thioredoxin)